MIGAYTKAAKRAPATTLAGARSVAIGSRPGITAAGAAAENGAHGRRRLSRRRTPRRSADWQAPEVLSDAERRRIAADIHDLIMQDVAFALANARAITHDPSLPADCVSASIAACERALAGAREVLVGLVSRSHQPVVAAVEAAVRAAARDARLVFDARVPAEVQPDKLTTEVLVHIGREAVTNAIKHADAMIVTVSLEFANGWRLLVSDEGCGFDPSAGSNGFGLGSMRRQAKAIGGSVLIVSAPDSGTVIEGFLP